jgi:hypothetical protein
VHDLGEAHEAGVIGELELLDEHVEGAFPVPVGVLSTLRIVRVAALALGGHQHPISRAAKRNSASESMNGSISQGQAILSTFAFSRVTHLMRSLPSLGWGAAKDGA